MKIIKEIYQFKLRKLVKLDNGEWMTQSKDDRVLRDFTEEEKDKILDFIGEIKK